MESLYYALQRLLTESLNQFDPYLYGLNERQKFDDKNNPLASDSHTDEATESEAENNDKYEQYEKCPECSLGSRKENDLMKEEIKRRKLEMNRSTETKYFLASDYFCTSNDAATKHKQCMVQDILTWEPWKLLGAYNKAY
jgi:hypothetical protein